MLVTVTGELAGTMTEIESNESLPPAATLCVEAHVTIVVPEQLHPAPL